MKYKYVVWSTGGMMLVYSEFHWRFS